MQEAYNWQLIDHLLACKYDINYITTGINCFILYVTLSAAISLRCHCVGVFSENLCDSPTRELSS